MTMANLGINASAICVVAGFILFLLGEHWLVIPLGFVLAYFATRLFGPLAAAEQTSQHSGRPRARPWRGGPSNRR